MFTQSAFNFLWGVLFSLEPGRFYSIQIPLMKKWWQWSQVLEACNRARILDTTGSRKEAKFTYPSVRLAAELIQYCVLERERDAAPNDDRLSYLMLKALELQGRPQVGGSLSLWTRMMQSRHSANLYLSNFFLFGDQTFHTNPISRTSLEQHETRFPTWTSFWLRHRNSSFKYCNNMKLWVLLL